MAKITFTPFFAFLLGCAAVLCCRNPAVGESQFTSEDFLSSSGTHVVNRRGEIVLQRGFNIGGWLIKSIYMSPISGAADDTDVGNILENRFGQAEADRLQQVYLDNYMTSADFDTIAATGANSVRLPFWWRNFMDENGDFILNNQGKPDFSMLDYAVAECAARGMYVTFELHGAPGSQNGTQQSGYATENPTFFARDAVGEANRATTVELWAAIAEHFADEPAVAGYDILGEPYWTGVIGPDERWWIWEFYDDAYQAIRAVDQNHQIILESSWNVEDLPHPSATETWKEAVWDNVAYSVHYYPRPWEEGEAEILAGFETRFNRDMQTQQDYNVPIYIGETNYHEEFGVWEEVLDTFETSDWSYSVWAYKCPLSAGAPWGTIYCGPVDWANVSTMSSAQIEAVFSQTSITAGMTVHQDYADMLTERFSTDPNTPELEIVDNGSPATGLHSYTIRATGIGIQILSKFIIDGDVFQVFDSEGNPSEWLGDGSASESETTDSYVIFGDMRIPDLGGEEWDYDNYPEGPPDKITLEDIVGDGNSGLGILSNFDEILGCWDAYVKFGAPCEDEETVDLIQIVVVDGSGFSIDLTLLSSLFYDQDTGESFGIEHSLSILMPTLIAGDANGDGFVDADDVAILSQHWLQEAGATWADGDFNHDGKVNDVDATLLACNWNPQTANVPEPSVLVLLSGLSLSFIGLMERRRKEIN